jgi:hypothetical protein
MLYSKFQKRRSMATPCIEPFCLYLAAKWCVTETLNVDETPQFN